MYEPTLYRMSEDFKHINELCFDSALSKPIMYISDIWWLGEYSVDTGGQHHVVLRHKFADYSEYFGTLAHEMVHQWQVEVLGNKRAKHNKKFRAKCQELKEKLGVNVE